MRPSSCTFRSPASSCFKTLFSRLYVTSTVTSPRRYHYPDLDGVEDLEKYQSGGFHPILIGDVVGNGRYKVVHKLGFGGSSTVWLAREQHPKSPETQGSLVALKVLSADQSSKALKDMPELYIPRELESRFKNRPLLGKENLQTVLDHFFENGPNGFHLCIVSQFSGPSMLSMSDSPGRVSGSKRLRGVIVRDVSRQVASAVAFLHSAGVVHGDLTSSNVVFQLSRVIHGWSDTDLYSLLGVPETENVLTSSGGPDPCAPSYVVAAAQLSRLAVSRLIQENILLIDYGRSFFVDCRPADYTPGTPLHYLAPEAIFESRVSFASDVWALACTIFHIRTGSPLFEPMFGYHIILQEMVATLGRLPSKWWEEWPERVKWFDETGMPRQNQNSLLPAELSSIRQKLREVGAEDQAPDHYEGDMIENAGTVLEEREVALLGDLLEKMLKYRPEERITMADALRHPWFDYDT